MYTYQQDKTVENSIVTYTLSCNIRDGNRIKMEEKCAVKIKIVKLIFLSNVVKDRNSIALMNLEELI